MLTIYLKNDTKVDISDFEEVKYIHNSRKVITKENLDDLFLNDRVTYLFSGKNKCIINGSEIRYIELT